MTTRWIIGCAALLTLWTGVIVGQSGARADFSDDALLRQFLTDRAAATVEPARCAECHKSEFDVWEDTLHATQYDTMHRKDSAKEIYKKLGLGLVRRATDTNTPACLQCHYTPKEDSRGVLRASIGVSCESCHGPARDWVAVHSNYEVPGASFPQEAAAQETADHKLQRIENSRANGQLRPSDIYGVVANCFGCHNVPSERLVNVGGHSPGGGFDLLAGLDDIRHNFLQSFLTGDGKTNAERPRDYKRVLFVVSRAVDVEFTLRGLAAATTEDLYLESLVDRYDAVADGLAEILDLEPIPEIEEIRGILGGVSPKANNAGPMTAAADAVADAAKRFIASTDGAQLAGVDLLWDPDAPVPVVQPSDDPVVEPPPPTGDPVVAPPTPPVPPPGDPVVAPPPPTPPTGRAAGSPPVATDPTPVPPAPTPAPSARPRLPGQIQSRPDWRPVPAHQYYSSVPCTGSCHKPQKKWFPDDPHAAAVTPFRDGGRRRQMEIATAYGLTGEQMNQGGGICMSCHGTATSRSPTSAVRKGVGCQQCHGAGKDFRGDHEEMSRAERLAAGMIDLKDAQTRAETCAGCHYITDPRLLTAGHVSGDDFEIDDRMETIKHWGSEFDGQATDMPAATMLSAHGSVIAARGPVPQVTPVSSSPSPGPAAAPATGTNTPPAPPPATPPAGGGAVPPAVAPPPDPTQPGTPPVTPPPTVTSPVPPTPQAGAATPSVTTPNQPAAPGSVTPPTRTPRPAVAPTASVDEMLVELKRRLEAMYARLRGGGR